MAGGSPSAFVQGPSRALLSPPTAAPHAAAPGVSLSCCRFPSASPASVLSPTWYFLWGIMYFIAQQWFLASFCCFCLCTGFFYGNNVAWCQGSSLAAPLIFHCLFIWTFPCVHSSTSWRPPCVRRWPGWLCRACGRPPPPLQVLCGERRWGIRREHQVSWVGVSQSHFLSFRWPRAAPASHVTVPWWGWGRRRGTWRGGEGARAWRSAAPVQTPGRGGWQFHRSLSRPACPPGGVADLSSQAAAGVPLSCHRALSPGSPRNLA